MGAHDALRIVEKQGSRNSRGLLLEHASGELVFGVVGHVGSGNSEVARTLTTRLKEEKYAVEHLKASDRIREWATSVGRALPGKESTLETESEWQTLGDAMRSAKDDDAAVARALILEIRRIRALRQNQKVSDEPVLPDGTRRAYVLDSLRHDAEVQLVRHVYGNAFALVGVVCDEEVRHTRLASKYRDAGRESSADFMQRDSKSSHDHGQRVSAAFELADYYLDNSENRFLDQNKKQSNPNWDIPEQLSRLIKIINHTDVIRPTVAETGMYYAHGARMRSACLSRQVGAALIDKNGNILATGTNEAPMAGGGVYRNTADAQQRDCRCAFRDTPECSNNAEQNRIIEELFEKIPELATLKNPDRAARVDVVRGARIGGLVEFSRAVHAEMDAILAAARVGASPVGSRMFVTTFPCHFCARHLVAAGVFEVQYIEPYPKSRALALHEDAITTRAVEWRAPDSPDGKVLFRPFTGVAPRLYQRAFLKDRELKDSAGRKEIQAPKWGSAWHLSRNSYVQLEAELAKLD